jgi:glycosyltransferase involved in cell wall biosynthesis
VKVVHVTLRFDAPGGVETNVRELSRRLVGLGDEVEVFASDLYDEASWDRRTNYRPTVDGVPVRRFGIRREMVPRLNLPMMVGLIDALADSGADVIHAHSHRYGHVLQAAAVAARTGVPLVISTSYHPADRRESRRNRLLLRLDDHAFGMTAYRVARAIVVQSELERRLLAEFAPAARLRIVPPGVDLAEWSHPEQDRADGLDLPPEFTLYAGRIASNKGLAFLIEALARVPASERRPLVLMGSDWGERASLEALAARRGVADRLVFLGHVPARSAYRAVFRAARSFVLPSEWEAYGFVLLEAMAARTPILASAVGAVPEVVGHGRYAALVPYGDTAALARGLVEVGRDVPECAARVREGFEHVRTLDWAASAQRFHDLYREVAAG